MMMMPKLALRYHLENKDDMASYDNNNNKW